MPGVRTASVGQSVTDPILGDRITVLSVARAPASTSPMIVRVEVRVSAGTRFARGVNPAAFVLVEPDARTDRPTPEPASATYPALLPTPPGQDETGWLAFDPISPTGLQLLYDRSALTVVGSGEVIPAATYAIQLPN